MAQQLLITILMRIFISFFQVPQKEVKEGMPLEVFPPVEPIRVEKREKIAKLKQETRKEPRWESFPKKIVSSGVG